jgi:hypothetical protein
MTILDEEAGEEDQIAEPPNHFPDTPSMPQELAVIPDQVCQPIHSAPSLAHHDELKT